MKTLAFEVTQEDIDIAMTLPEFSGDWSASCPIATALKRIGFKDVSVMNSWMDVDGERFDFDQGSEIEEYISNIDHHHNKYWQRRHIEIELKPILPTSFFLDKDDE